MVKVCFIYNTPFIEKAVIQNLRDELDRLSEKETEIEFWFHGFHSYFNKAVLREVIQLKTDKPDQQLEIVDIVDPVIEEDDLISMPIHTETGETVPEWHLRLDEYDYKVPARVEYAPRFEFRSDNKAGHFIAHSQRKDRWMVNSCDYLFAYTYENLPDSANTTIKRALAKNPDMKIISLCVPSTAERIEELKEQLDERKKYVVDSFLAGVPSSVISKELGVTINRVHQIASKATRIIYRQLKKEYR